MDTSQAREAEKNWDVVVFEETQILKWHQGIGLVGSETVRLIDNLCFIQLIMLYVILWEQSPTAL